MNCLLISSKGAKKIDFNDMKQFQGKIRDRFLKSKCFLMITHFFSAGLFSGLQYGKIHIYPVSTTQLKSTLSVNIVLIHQGTFNIKTAQREMNSLFTSSAFSLKASPQ